MLVVVGPLIEIAPVEEENEDEKDVLV